MRLRMLWGHSDQVWSFSGEANRVARSASAIAAPMPARRLASVVSISARPGKFSAARMKLLKINFSR
jgi:hypothetical protein